MTKKRTCNHKRARYLGTRVHFDTPRALPAGRRWFSECTPAERAEILASDRACEPLVVAHCYACGTRIERTPSGRVVSAFKVDAPVKGTPTADQRDVYTPQYDGVDAATSLDPRPSIFSDVLGLGGAK